LGIQLKHDPLETALTDQRHLELVMTVHRADALLVPVEIQFDLNLSGRSIQQSAEARHPGSGYRPFQGDATVCQAAGFDVCRYGSRHKRAILGTRGASVKTIWTESLHLVPPRTWKGRIERIHSRRHPCPTSFSRPARLTVARCWSVSGCPFSGPPRI